MKDGRTRLGYKPEHAVDLDTGAIVAAEIHRADRGDTTTLPGTLEAAQPNLAAVDAAPTREAPAELVADKGYHSRDGLKELEDSAWKSRVAEKKAPDVHRWHGDTEARIVRSTTTGSGYAQAWPRKRSSAGPSWSS